MGVDCGAEPAAVTQRPTDRKVHRKGGGTVCPSAARGGGRAGDSLLAAHELRTPRKRNSARRPKSVVLGRGPRRRAHTARKPTASNPPRPTHLQEARGTRKWRRSRRDLRAVLGSDAPTATPTARVICLLWRREGSAPSHSDPRRVLLNSAAATTNYAYFMCMCVYVTVCIKNKIDLIHVWWSEPLV